MITGLQTEAADSYRTFGNTRELARLVREDLATLLSERFAASARPAVVARPTQATLPTTSTSLIGREDDIAAVSTMLESPDVRLVTLTGPGGIGKTRLAIAVGSHVEERSAIQTVFVPLSTITDSQLVMPRVAAVVGETIEGTRTALDVLTEHFAHNPTLLVLDNLEQINRSCTRSRPTARGLSRCEDPRDQPHRAAAACGAGVLGCLR